MPEVEPGGVGARYEQVDHGSVRPVQQVFPQPEQHGRRDIAGGRPRYNLPVITEGSNGVEDSGDSEESGEDSSVDRGSVELGGVSS